MKTRTDEDHERVHQLCTALTFLQAALEVCANFPRFDSEDLEDLEELIDSPCMQTPAIARHPSGIGSVLDRLEIFMELVNDSAQDGDLKI